MIISPGSNRGFLFLAGAFVPWRCCRHLLVGHYTIGNSLLEISLRLATNQNSSPGTVRSPLSIEISVIERLAPGSSLWVNRERFR